MRGIHRWPVNSPHKGPVTRKMFPLDDVIMTYPMKYFLSFALLITEWNENRHQAREQQKWYQFVLCITRWIGKQTYLSIRYLEIFQNYVIQSWQSDFISRAVCSGQSHFHKWKWLSSTTTIDSTLEIYQIPNLIVLSMIRLSCTSNVMVDDDW